MRARLILTAAVLVTASAPGFAQDIYMDMASDSLASAGSYAGTVAVNSHLNNNSRNRARAMRSNRTARQAQACASLPRFRQQYGAAHPQVRQLTRLCRQAGF